MTRVRVGELLLIFFLDEIGVGSIGRVAIIWVLPTAKHNGKVEFISARLSAAKHLPYTDMFMPNNGRFLYWSAREILQLGRLNWAADCS